MVGSVTSFLDKTPDLETYWRSIILFGRNVASNKFALAKSLIELGSREQEFISLEELAEPFARHVCRHLKNNAAQTTQRPGKFLKACMAYNSQEIDLDGLITQTKKEGFRYVIDHFHVVNRGQPCPLSEIFK